MYALQYNSEDEMSEKATPEELRARAINGVESYKAGYRHGLAESEQEVGLLRLTIEQLKTRIDNADEHIRLLEATVLRIGAPADLPEDATVVYSHRDDPRGAVRYRQYAKDPLPPWAANVKLEGKINDPSAIGYRPPCCDGEGGSGSKCCEVPCLANRELREMGLLR